MNTKSIKSDRGVAGLTILLSLVVMLFIIGLLISIFSIMGSELKDSTYDIGTGSVVNETMTAKVTSAGVNLAYSTLLGGTCTITLISNSTGAGETIPSTNYTQSNCALLSTAYATYNNSVWNVSYSYTYDVPNTATGVMNDTINGVSGTSDWFDIFIVIGAMVVLILLTVIIITSIRSSGMIDSGSRSGANTVGTA